MKALLNEFKEFINRGNVIDMAVGVIIGGAFTAIVTSLTDNIINPLISVIAGGSATEISGLVVPGTNIDFGAFIGAFVAVAIAGNFAGDSPAPFYIAMVMAAVGGSLFALIHAMLCLKFKANQVISGVVVNILAMALTAYLTKLFNRVVFGATSDKFVLTVSSRITIPGISKIPVLGAVFTNLYPFELVIVAVAFIAWFVMYKTRFGMHLRACGDNPHAVDAAGRQVGQIRLAAIMICGALSGLGGICFAYSISANFSSSIYVGYGYLAIAALIFGNWRILPTLGACLLFGFARSGGYRLVQVLQMPSSYQDLVMILPYVLTLLLLVFFSKQNGAPRALGVIYDKGAR